MKGLVLCGMAWVEMLAHCWSLSNDLQLASMSIPARSGGDGSLGDEIAKEIERLRPDFILDVNGHGLAELSGDSGIWTPQAAGVPWVEWWFDDPAIYAGQHEGRGRLEAFIKTLESPCVRHFIWDAALAREYSRWSGRTWTHLPTATHPGMFHPDAAAHSKLDLGSHELFFAGTYHSYPFPPESELEGCGAAYATGERLRDSRLSYFEIASKAGAPASLKSAFPAEGPLCLGAAFRPELRSLRHLCNIGVALERRNKPLEGLRSSFSDCLFIGEGWPETFKARREKVYGPADLAALFAASGVSADLGNGQSFSGTNMRAYEAMSCEGLLACDYGPEFDPDGSLRDKVYLRFENAAELKDKLESLFSKAGAAREMRKAARAYSVAEHSWLKRLPPILESLS